MNYFPLSLATGNAFCNRKEELSKILYNLEHNIPTLLSSPRRYGKTSLALKALEKSRWPFTHIDLYKALSEDDIARFVLNGIGGLLGQIENTPKKLMKTAAEFFSGFQLKFSFEKIGISVEFSRKEKRPIDLILAALERLDDYVLKNKKTAVIFLDEFQTIAEVANNNSIEAAIREAVQKAKAVRYLFSGSNRHLIESMFNDRNRPFYKLCDQMTVYRIAESHYIKYINNAAKVYWGKVLTQGALDAIFEVTELHPYYVNRLCSLVWHRKKPPTAEDIYATWYTYVDETKSRVEQEVDLLTLNQKKLLLNLASSELVTEPYGKESTLQWGMSSTSIHRAMETLITKDYVFLDHDKNYRVLDPLFRSALSE